LLLPFINPPLSDPVVRPDAAALPQFLPHSWWAVCVSLAVAYLPTGRLGLLLAVPLGYATATFLPAGIAVAGMYIAGAVTLPATFVASFLLNL
jgi:hypothetical protein